MRKSEMGLVDNLIYEVYKDKRLDSSSKFKREVKANYGYEPSSDLYIKLVNYQVEKYGKQVVSGDREFQKNFNMTARKRIKQRIRTRGRYHDIVELERMENEKKC